MKLNEYILRHKLLSLVNQPSEKMDLEILNPNADIIDTNDNIVHLFKEIKLKIVEKNSKSPIAEFELGIQCEVLLDPNTDFSNDEFTQMIMPILHVYVSEMMDELKLPQIPFMDFSNFLLENKQE